MKTRLTRPAAALAATGLALSLTGCVESGRSSSATTETDAAEVSACPWEPDESVTTTARIAWQAIPNADLVVKDLGLLEACLPNADISWVQAASGGDVVKYYGSGDVDLGLMGSSPATIASSEPVVRDVDLAVVWIHDVIGEAESLVARDPEVTDIADLEGGKIGVPFSSTAHYSLLQALDEAGLDPATDVEVINLDPEKMPGAWQGDQIDAAWVWDPVQSQLLEDGGTRILSSADTAKAGRPTFDVGTADKAFLAENPEFMAQWARVQDHAVGLIKDDPATAAESVAVVLGIDPADAEKQFGGLSYLSAQEQVDYLSGSFPKDLLTTAGFLLDQGGIDAVGDQKQYADHVDAGPARSAVGG
ncbi:taurine ABC transporter substrate-binding protein [Nocardioides abyssi]|uniref:ABC transporter substrate-binding protein n=1 Tax=Nocardioides abyssi TaxID=3058370 RepID=A0ABT8EUH3_9ACTN|nr:ABC transporter substrate-binding protein [Nocardioides abyssi]MDN4161821.1 ABC transporter substrate-binding protein [Nocardioides abyssi]